jgi:DNA-binding transcriptional MerR regulator
MEQSEPLQAPEVPQKLYFRIGEVSRLVGVEPYVLRYWETEFPGLSPGKSDAGQRLYRRKHVELFLEIKRLLYEKRFTIEGARKQLESKPKARSTPRRAPPAAMQQPDLFSQSADLELLRDVRRELAAILNLLK